MIPKNMFGQCGELAKVVCGEVEHGYPPSIDIGGGFLRRRGVDFAFVDPMILKNFRSVSIMLFIDYFKKTFSSPRP